MSYLTLNDIPVIAQALKFGNTQDVKLLYSVIFNDHPFSRTSREQLRKFTGFAQDFDIEDYSAVILKKLNLPDLICLANFLQLETNGTAEELCNNIWLSLADLSAFHNKLNTRGVEECPPRDAENSFASPLSTDRKSADAFSQINESAVPSISKNDLSWLFVKDLLLTLHSFSADDSYSIEHFFSDVEENLTFCPITEQQKNVFVKRLLTGTAKLFIQSQRGINSYSCIKTLLIQEFGKKINQYHMHRELQNRKMRPNETVFQYLVAIRELANRGQGFLDETSIMEYCINGIPDSPSNKLILYGCTTIQEFKEKLGIYDKIFQNKSKNRSYDTSRNPNFSSQRRDVESTLHKHRYDRYPKFNAPKPNSKFENKNFRDRNHVTCFNCSGSAVIFLNFAQINIVVQSVY
ncbi:uncharacterized protein TNCV_3091871 [Trichonephila clavipes]|nr:uncharacterized protein TNCV_3091871 [Trichonephila clavipes]